MSTSDRLTIFSLAVETTPVCNQRCRYCYNAWRSDDPRLASHGSPGVTVARLRHVIEQVTLQQVTLTGGEPLSSPALFDLLSLLATHCIPSNIISNGVLVTEAIADRLADQSLGYVQVTLDGPDAATHEMHTVTGQFEATLRGMELLSRRGIAVGGCIVITRRNAALVGATLERFRAMGVRQVALSRFSPAGAAIAHAAELLPSLDDVVEAFEQAKPFAADHGMHLVSTMPLPPCAVESSNYHPIQFGSCSVGTSMQEFALGVDGRLRHCALHRHPIDPRDVAEVEDLSQVFRHAEVTGYRNRAPSFCAGCLHERSCAGGCLAASEWMFGARCSAPDPFLWQHLDDEFADKLAAQRCISTRSPLESVP